MKYEATIFDGYSARSSSADLYDKVTVRWVDDTGKQRNTVRTQTVQVLSDAGISRQAVTDLGSPAGSSANAIQAGDGFLGDHATPPNGGTLIVARPVVDTETGRMVQPWEIRPGNLVRVRGVAGRVDALNPSTRDGSTVFRIAAHEYRAADAAATLELDTYPRTVAQALRRLQKSMPARK